MGQDLKAKTTALEKEIPPMKKSDKRVVDRRKFLKGAAVGGVATLVAGTGHCPSAANAGGDERLGPAVPPPEADPPSEVSMLTVDRSGSDFMVDVIKSLGFEYVAANPGSSFRGIHESLINYGGNKNPEFITCCHEESSVALGSRLCARSKASRCSSWRTAPWACSMRRWVSTTPGPAGRPSSS